MGPACGGGDIEKCKEEVCSKCKAQGPDGMKNLTDSLNCSSVVHQFFGHALAPRLIETPKALRYGSATCGSSSDECKIGATTTPGVTANLLLEKVSSGCCSQIHDLSMDLQKLLQQFVNNHTIPKPGDLSDLAPFCSQCASEKNELLSTMVTALRENPLTKQYCVPSGTIEDLTV